MEGGRYGTSPLQRPTHPTQPPGTNPKRNPDIVFMVSQNAWPGCQVPTGHRVHTYVDNQSELYHKKIFLVMVEQDNYILKNKLYRNIRGEKKKKKEEEEESMIKDL
jgi:hypothetical protein